MYNEHCLGLIFPSCLYAASLIIFFNASTKTIIYPSFGKFQTWTWFSSTWNCSNWIVTISILYIIKYQNGCCDDFHLLISERGTFIILLKILSYVTGTPNNCNFFCHPWHQFFIYCCFIKHWYYLYLCHYFSQQVSPFQSDQNYYHLWSLWHITVKISVLGARNNCDPVHLKHCIYACHCQ